MDANDLAYPRRIVVDDTDPRITYTAGNWDLDVSSFDSFGILGDPYNNTLKGTNSQFASFTFSFEGTYIRVKGAKDNSKIPRPADSTTDPRELLPRWTCQLDDVPVVKSLEYPPGLRNTTHITHCEQGYLPKRRHTLTVNVTINDPSTQVFWVDSIEYAPLENIELPAKEIMRVDSSDASCSYHNNTGQWQNRNPGNMTYEKGATMSFKFNGTSVSLYGILVVSNPRGRFSLNSTDGYYSVDNGEPIQFTIPGSKPFPSDPGNDTFWYNQLLFNTSRIEGGREHEIAVTYSGVASGQNVPQVLNVDYFHVFNDWVPENTSSPLPKGDEQGSRGKNLPIGVIVGSVLGGVLGLLLISGLGWVLVKRWRKNRKGERGPDGSSNLLENVAPFNETSLVSGGESPQTPVSVNVRALQPGSGEGQGNFVGVRRAQQEDDSRQEEDSGKQASTIGSPQLDYEDGRENFIRMKRAQQEAVNTPRREQDSGLRYSGFRSERASTLPPVYTP